MLARGLVAPLETRKGRLEGRVATARRPHGTRTLAPKTAGCPGGGASLLEAHLRGLTSRGLKAGEGATGKPSCS